MRYSHIVTRLTNDKYCLRHRDDVDETRDPFKRRTIRLKGGFLRKTDDKI